MKCIRSTYDLFKAGESYPLVEKGQLGGSRCTNTPTRKVGFIRSASTRTARTKQTVIS
ncbi:hypothetical protein [Enterobacter phage N5822]|nr:hypothetical protein [Enterobacter phage N5822]